MILPPCFVSTMILASSIHEAIIFAPPSSATVSVLPPSSIIAAAPPAQQAWLLNNPTNKVEPVKPTIQIMQPPSSSIYIANTEWTQQLLHLRKQSTTVSVSTDKVKRVIDSSTILLEKSGIVSLDVVRGAGSTYVLPECCTYAPAYKLKQLLKKDTLVKVINLSTAGNTSSTSSARPKVWIVRSQDDLNVNRELVRTGFGFVRKGGGAYYSNNKMMDSSVLSNFDYEGMINEMTDLEKTARSKGMGIFKVCDDGINVDNNNGGNDDAVSTSNFIAEFEPMEYTTEIQYGDDGGKSVIVSNSDKQQGSFSSITPSNPGDVRGCSDFTYYEDALGYYERYYPYYGDVAKLDRDGDGVPCPGLPHTSNQDRYRMKRPK